MRYMGGKSRISKKIASIINSVQLETYLEPFVGSAAVMENVKIKNRIGGDSNEALISLFCAIQNGWLPPQTVSLEEYLSYKNQMNLNDPMTAFVGFGCSFSGKWFGGYARSGTRNYAMNARNSLIKQREKILNVTFVVSDYIQWNPSASCIYCDPPYCGTTKYDAIGNFDSKLFWETMRKWSTDNTVIISEYNAPEDFIEIKRFDTKLDMHSNDDGRRIEKIFQYKNTTEKYLIKKLKGDRQ